MASPSRCAISCLTPQHGGKYCGAPRGESSATARHAEPWRLWCAAPLNCAGRTAAIAPGAVRATSPRPRGRRALRSAPPRNALRPEAVARFRAQLLNTAASAVSAAGRAPRRPVPRTFGGFAARLPNTAMTAHITERIAAPCRAANGRQSREHRISCSGRGVNHCVQGGPGATARSPAQLTNNAPSIVSAVGSTSLGPLPRPLGDLPRIFPTLR